MFPRETMKEPYNDVINDLHPFSLIPKLEYREQSRSLRYYPAFYSDQANTSTISFAMLVPQAKEFAYHRE